MLPSTTLVLVALCFLRRALVFESRRSLLKCPLIATEPSIPAVILRDDATPDEALCGLVKVAPIAQDQLRVSQLVDFQRRATIAEQLSKPYERIRSKTAAPARRFHFRRVVHIVDLPVRPSSMR